jgi:copper chaperone CopZ
MHQINLFVGGMSCRRCVREVTARLRDVPGVVTVTANSGDSVVRLSGDMDPGDVLAAFTGTTYRPEIQHDRGRNSDGTEIGQTTP